MGRCRASRQRHQPEQWGHTRRVTDARGGYSFAALSPGVDTIKAALAGFHETQRTDVRLAIASQVEVAFVLEVGGVQETVTVSSVAPLVNSTEQAVRTNIEDFTNYQGNQSS